MDRRLTPVSLKCVRDLPVFPAIGSQAILAAQNTSSAAELEERMSSDIVFANTVLCMANSVYFSVGEEITDFAAAVARLGISAVRALVLGTSAISCLNPLLINGRFTHEGFWTHSFSVALASKMIAESQDGLYGPTAFLIGLLHDVGKLILGQHYPEQLADILLISEKNNTTFAHAEKTVNANHAEIGADLLEVWGFPRILSVPIRWHHASMFCPRALRSYATVVQTADHISNEERVGHSGTNSPGTMPYHCSRHVSMKERAIRSFVTDASAESAVLSSLVRP